MNKFSIAISGVLLSILFFFLSPVDAQRRPNCFVDKNNNFICQNGGRMEFWTGSTLDIDSGATVAIADNVTMSAGNLTLTTGNVVATAGDVTAGDDATVSDDLTVGGFTRITAQTGITVTTAAFTPTGTYQPIASAGTVTPTITVLAAGTMVRLVNTTNTSIVLVDTSTVKLAGNITLGQYDSLTLVSDGANWIELARSNN